jgi:SHS family lactate transporter-like MFS transporter
MIPMWCGAMGNGLLVLGAFLIQFTVQGAWGVVPAHITELSPDAVRGFLPGFAYQCGVLIAGNAAHIEAQLSKQGSYSSAMKITALVVFCAGAVVVILGPERRGEVWGKG